jgi:hypothetical protein
VSLVPKQCWNRTVQTRIIFALWWKPDGVTEMGSLLASALGWVAALSKIKYCSFRAFIKCMIMDVSHLNVCMFLVRKVGLSVWEVSPIWYEPWSCSTRTSSSIRALTSAFASSLPVPHGLYCQEGGATAEYALCGGKRGGKVEYFCAGHADSNGCFRVDGDRAGKTCACACKQDPSIQKLFMQWANLP